MNCAMELLVVNLRPPQLDWNIRATPFEGKIGWCRGESLGVTNCLHLRIDWTFIMLLN